MKLHEIKCAVDCGMRVTWSNDSYRVVKDSLDQWLIVHKGSTIGLTHRDGATLNGDEQEFHCDEWSRLNTFQRESICRLWCVGIIAKPLANWITCETPDGWSHTVMSEQGIDALVDMWESE